MTRRGLWVTLLLVGLVGFIWAQTAYAQASEDRPEILSELDRLKSYARELKAARDQMEYVIADLKLYAQRLEKVIQDRDREIQALKAIPKP